MSKSELRVTINTTRGPIQLALFADKAPLTVANFLNLAKRGYYNGKTFHRVIEDFMVQTGCPYGTGMGGPGYQFGDEFCPDLRHDAPGILSMANAGPGTNGSQFFITHVATPWLDDKHTVFGKVISHTDQVVVNHIVQGDKIHTVIIEDDVTELLNKFEDQLKGWNAIIDENFPYLQKDEETETIAPKVVEHNL
ncbi:MAG: peptidylprolyl isomerase [Candidatus Margulisiibacteriota bacterium]